jgi:hypothetical protein
MQNKTEGIAADCIIEQYHTMKDVKGFVVYANVKEHEFRPFWDTIAITRVYLKPWYKEQMENDFHYTY